MKSHNQCCYDCLKLLIIAIVFFVLTFYLYGSLDGGRNSGKNGPNSMASRLLSVDFEVFGRVQGVFFRKYTRNAAHDYDLVGWCLNTQQDTVKGQMQGAAENIAKMKHWLQNVGSPHSRIDKAVFQNEKEIEKLEYKTFSVEH